MRGHACVAYRGGVPRGLAGSPQGRGCKESWALLNRQCMRNERYHIDRGRHTVDEPGATEGGPNQGTRMGGTSMEVHERNLSQQDK